MKQTIRILFSVLCLVAGFAAVQANPLPGLYVHVNPADGMQGVILSPGHPTPLTESILHLSVRNESNQPIAHAPVVVSFAPGIVPCPDAQLETVTDENGEAEVTLAGGGCLSAIDGACSIRVNGIEVRAYRNAKSPDWDGIGSDRRVSSGDFIGFARAFNQPAPGGCYDFDNSGLVGGADFAIFARAFNAGSHCP